MTLMTSIASASQGGLASSRQWKHKNLAHKAAPEPLDLCTSVRNSHNYRTNVSPPWIQADVCGSDPPTTMNLTHTLGSNFKSREKPGDEAWLRSGYEAPKPKDRLLTKWWEISSEWMRG